MIGQIIGDNRYEIRQQLGKKAGRQTLLAWDRETQEQVVIKLLTFSQEFAWDDLKLFEREAEALRSLSHACIPQYRDFFEFAQPHGQGFALVQSYVEGRSLEQHLKSGQTFSESDVKQLAQSLLDILIYLHSRHPPLVHRDIKPSNILLSDRSGHSIGQVYLVDFGSVQTLLAKESGTITIVGTYGYMPPEQFGGRARPASDLYSLGATLIYLLTGKHPADIPQKQFRLQFEALVQLSPDFARWLTQLIDPDLETRLSSAKQALHSLNHPKSYPMQTDENFSSSRVTLSVTPDRLTIRFPKAKLEKINLSPPQFIKLLTIVLKLYPVWLGVSLFLGGRNAFLGTVLLLIVSKLGLQIISKFFKTDLARYCILNIDSKQVTLSLDSRGKSQTLLSASRNAITELEYQPASYESDGAVRIWAGKQVYELGGDRSLSPEEVRWLANELSDWLPLPSLLQLRNPTAAKLSCSSAPPGLTF